MDNKNKYKKYNKETRTKLDLMDGMVSQMNQLDVFEKFCPRRYRIPSGYYDPAFYSALEMAMDINKDNGCAQFHSDDGSIRRETNYNYNADITLKVQGMLSHYMYPHYFLDRDLIKLLSMTQVADGVDLSKIKYPFDACLFTFPINQIKDVYSTTTFGHSAYLTQLGYARTFDIQTMEQQMTASKTEGYEDTDGRIYQPDTSRKWAKTLELEDEEKGVAQRKILAELDLEYKQPCRIVPSFSVTMAYDTGDLGVASYPIDGSGLQDILKKYENHFTVDGIRAEFVEAGMIQNEISSMQSLIKLVVTLILYMSSKKSEYELEPKKENKSYHRNGKREKSNIYGANFLGAKYKGYISKQEKLIGSKRLKPHWRSGSLRTYWTGKGRKVPVQNWVMPYPVNVEDDLAA